MGGSIPRKCGRRMRKSIVICDMCSEEETFDSQLYIPDKWVVIRLKALYGNYQPKDCEKVLCPICAKELHVNQNDFEDRQKAKTTSERLIEILQEIAIGVQE